MAYTHRRCSADVVEYRYGSEYRSYQLSPTFKWSSQQPHRADPSSTTSSRRSQRQLHPVTAIYRHRNQSPRSDSPRITDSHDSTAPSAIARPILNRAIPHHAPPAFHPREEFAASHCGPVSISGPIAVCEQDRDCSPFRQVRPKESHGPCPQEGVR